jgi:hypothetical protein
LASPLTALMYTARPPVLSPLLALLLLPSSSSSPPLSHATDSWTRAAPLSSTARSSS